MIVPPLYNWGDLRYTIDGTDPGPDSPRYEGRLNVAHPANLKAASFSPERQCGGITEARFDIDNKTPPEIQSVRLGPAGLRVVFNEPLEISTAQNVANYSLTPSLAIKSAKLSDGGDEVTLALAGMPDDDIQYKLNGARHPRSIGQRRGGEERDVWSTRSVPWFALRMFMFSMGRALELRRARN